MTLVYKKHTPLVSTTTITDIIYLSKKLFNGSERQKMILSQFFVDFKIVSVTKKVIQSAFVSPMTDFEDAVQAFVAKGKRAKLIITRNTKDYELSPVKAVTPSDFVAMVRRREKS